MNASTFFVASEPDHGLTNKGAAPNESRSHVKVEAFPEIFDEALRDFSEPMPISEDDVLAFHQILDWL